MGNTAQCRCTEEEDPHDVDGDILGDATVFLNIYDLNDAWLQSNQLSADILNFGGAFHAGVEVHGKEWSFGQEGISCQVPRTHEVHVYRTSIPMGRTSQAEAEVERYMELALGRHWHGGDYDMLERNCCSFAEVVCMHLVGRALPSWVTRFPRLACSASRGVNHLVNAAEQIAAEQANKLPCTPLRSGSALPDGEEHKPTDQFSEEEIDFDEHEQPTALKSQPPICHVHSVISRATTTMVSEASEFAQPGGCGLSLSRADCAQLVPTGIVV
mmetsp:Transcript_34689/g.79949  ORF Transcript_34689/g.79949 Transcript_34689/m.79949 type:complete len:271 (-) Transcript_34689:413-1225(-)